MKLKVWKIMSLLSIAVFVLTTANLVRATSTLTPTSTIPSVQGTMAYDSGKGELFVQYGIQYATVAVVSDSTNQVVTTITEGQSNGYNGDVAYDSGTGEIFAASGDAEVAVGVPPVITVISDSNNTIVNTITAASPGNSAYNWPYHPFGLVYDSSKGEIFVSDIHANAGSVYVISDSTNAVVATVGVGHYPGEMVYDSGMGEIFVANTGSNNISVISDSTNTVVATINVTATTLAYDPSKAEVFAYDGSSTVSVISDSTNNVVATITGVTPGLTTMAYDSGKGEIFAGKQVISDSTNTVISQLPTGVSGQVVYDSGMGETIAVTNSGLSLFSDSSSPSATATPTSSALATSTPTPTIPEFSFTAIVAVAAAMLIVTVCAVALTAKKRKQLRT